MPHHRLILGNSEIVLKSFTDNSLHLAVTSPPYFNAREYSQWSTLQAYLDDMEKIFKEVFRVLDNHRVFVLNVGDVNCLLGKQPWTKRRVPLGALFTVMCQEIGFEYVDNYIWHKGEPQSFRHMNGGKNYPFYHYPVNCYEHILIFHKHIKDLTRLPCPECGTSQVQNNSQSEIGVQSWECNNEGCSHRSEGNRGKRYSARSIMMDFGQSQENEIGKDFLKKWRKDIVEFPPVIKMYNGENKLGHSAPFPEDIPEMAIKLYTYKGDTVLDPFAGSFTTSLVAMKLGRNSVGIDTKKEFVNLGLRRLKERLKQKTLSGDGHSVEILEDKDIKDRVLNVDKSKVFHKETYVEESKTREALNKSGHQFEFNCRKKLKELGVETTSNRYGDNISKDIDLMGNISFLTINHNRITITLWLRLIGQIRKLSHYKIIFYSLDNEKPENFKIRFPNFLNDKDLDNLLISTYSYGYEIMSKFLNDFGKIQFSKNIYILEPKKDSNGKLIRYADIGNSLIYKEAEDLTLACEYFHKRTEKEFQNKDLGFPNTIHACFPVILTDAEILKGEEKCNHFIYLHTSIEKNLKKYPNSLRRDIRSMEKILE